MERGEGAKSISVRHVRNWWYPDINLLTTGAALSAIGAKPAFRNRVCGQTIHPWLHIAELLLSHSLYVDRTGVSSAWSCLFWVTRVFHYKRVYGGKSGRRVGLGILKRTTMKPQQIFGHIGVARLWPRDCETR